MRISERLLWRYIDGNLTNEEKALVENRIKCNPSVREAYDKLVEFHQTFQDFFAQSPSKLAPQQRSIDAQSEGEDPQEDLAKKLMFQQVRKGTFSPSSQRRN